MKRYDWLRKAAAVLFVGMLLIAAGCSSSSKESAEIDPPPFDLTTLAEQWEAIDQEMDITGGSTFKTTIYAEDPNGYLVPISLKIPFVERTAAQTLAYMTKGGPVEEMLPEGFNVLLPEGTEAVGIDIDEGIATVDFNAQFLNYEAHEERKLMESIVWTLTEMDHVDEVRVWVDGRPLNEMPVNGLPMNGNLSRAMGINLEYAKGVQLSQSMPVTLYFPSTSDDLEHYFVPVTRLIKKSDSVTEDLIHELIFGPSSTISGLQPVLASQVQLMNVTERDDTIEVQFSDTLIGEEEAIPAAALQSIVLSLTETTGAEQVQIRVNGHKEVLSSDGMDLSEPVNRPTTINPLDV